MTLKDMKRRIKEMSTRGAIGFYKNGIDKVAFNHWDSYPSGLGKKIVNFIESTSVEEMNKIFDKIILVENNEENYKCYECKGDLSIYKTAATKMIDDIKFMRDSLFCEWAYIINLDTNKLEVYRGFNQTKSNNRYQPACSNGQGYWGVSLFIEFPLDKIPNEIMSSLEKVAYSDE